MILKKSALAPLAMVLLLGACSGSDGYGLGNGGANEGGGDDGGDDGGTTTTSTVNLDLGTGSGSTFSSGDAAVAFTTSELPYAGSTTISVNVVDLNAARALYTTPVQVLFSSVCADAGLSQIGASTTSAAGVATVTYSSESCSGSDTVTATLSTGATAQITFEIAGLALGTGEDATFASGAMSDTLGGADLSYGGDAGISVNVVDDSTSLLFTADSIPVNFTSTCVESGESTIDATVDSRRGVATASYSAVTCTGSDTITATLNDGTTASTTITIADQEVGALQFVSASPTTLALQGSGSDTNPVVSEITFKLTDNLGGPVGGRTITFELSTTIGGVYLSPNRSAPFAITDTNGLASISLNSGAVPVGVSVTATYTDPDTNEVIKTTSNPIAIVGGVPDQDSFSLSLQTFNMWAGDFDGEASTITIRAADRFNNPAPDGTQVSFVTTGGSIVGTCALAGGTCSVDWTGQDPRPADFLAHIIARTSGEESFTDINGNGKYDDGEPILQHLDEAFIDDNFSGSHDPGEFFADFDEDGEFTTKPDTLFQGTGCSTLASNAGHCGRLVDVRETATVCMSTTRVTISDNGGGTLDVSGGANSLVVTIQDLNGLIPAVGTTVSVSAEDVELISADDPAVPNACVDGSGNPEVFSFVVIAQAEGATNGGLITIEVTGPDGLAQEYFITVTE